MLGRVQALKDSVTYQKTTQKNFKIKDQTRGFIQAQGLNQHLFEQVNGLPIQHQITNELLDVLDSVADYALHHPHQILQQHLISYCANLSSLTQQANHSNDLSVAMQGTNCCHGLYHYMNSLAGDVAHQYQHMVIALQYFNPVLEYGTAIAQGLIKGAAISCGIGAATALGMAVAPVATPIVLTSVVVATALLIGSQASTHLVTLGSHYIHSEWDQIDAYLNKSYEYVTSLQGVEKGAELVGGFATACYGGAMIQELQSLTSIRPVIATVHQSSGLVTESIGLMTAQALEEEMILSAKLLELPEFANFSMHYENIFGCEFFSILPESHPSLASAFEVAGMQGLLSSGEQTALSNFLMAQESSGVGSVAKSLIVSTISDSSSVIERAEINKITGSLRKRVSDLVRKGAGLENFSYDEIDLIAKTVKKERNIDIYRSGDLSKVNVKFTENSQHMFDDREGHRKDSPEFRAEIMSMVKNMKNYHGSDIHGNDWYSQISLEGLQSWAAVYQGIIKNCGMNEILQSYNPITGLSKLTFIKK